MDLFVKGLIAGFIIAMPLGPVSVLCFRRVLTASLLLGLVTVFGAAAADTVYGMVAGVGMTAITHLIQEHKIWLRFFAGAFLLLFGIMMIRSHPEEKDGAETTAGDLSKAFLSTFGMMIVNPVVIFSFFGVFAWLDLSAHHIGWVDDSLLAAGLFLGSSSWWIVYKLSFKVAGEKLKQYGIHAINFGSGILICGFGVWELIAAFVRRR